MGDTDGTDVERVTILHNLTLAVTLAVTLPATLAITLPIAVAVGASRRALPGTFWRALPGAFWALAASLPVSGWAGPTIIGVIHNGTLFVGYSFDP
jgi:hypothetical protein